MPSIRALWWLIAIIALVVPPYTFEKLAQYSFLTRNGLFSIFSGHRFYFDIVYLAFAAAVVGYRTRSLPRAWLANLLSVSLLIVLFYAVCEPKLCYSTGYDGLEPFRMGMFFSAAVLATTYLGSVVRGAWPSARWQRFLAGGSAFYAIAYNPVIFTLAGARILSPFGVVALLLFLSILSFIVVVSFAADSGAKGGVVPVACVGLMLLLGSGIAGQYIWEVLPAIISSLAATAIGAGVAVFASSRSTDYLRRIRRSRLPFTFLVLFVVLVTLVVWPDAVVGQVTTSSGAAYPRSYTYAIPLYAGGFMSSPMERPTAVAVTVTFSTSDSNFVPQGGYLAAGIGVHSPDCCTDGIDYGYRFDVLLAANGSESFVADAWKVCDANAACGGHSWKVLMYHLQKPLKGVQPGSSLKLVLQWENHAVDWTYWSGSGPHLVATFQAPSREDALFNAGWPGPPENPTPGGAFFFQFGVSAASSLENGWSVRFDCPSILLNGTWGCISHAESLQGDQSYWKVLWRWGENFPNVGAVANQTSHSVDFVGSSSEMESFEKFW